MASRGFDLRRYQNHRARSRRTGRGRVTWCGPPPSRVAKHTTGVNHDTGVTSAVGGFRLGLAQVELGPGAIRAGPAVEDRVLRGIVGTRPGRAHVDATTL